MTASEKEYIKILLLSFLDTERNYLRKLGKDIKETKVLIKYYIRELENTFIAEIRGIEYNGRILELTDVLESYEISEEITKEKYKAIYKAIYKTELDSYDKALLKEELGSYLFSLERKIKRLSNIINREENTKEERYEKGELYNIGVRIDAEKGNYEIIEDFIAEITN
jgi:hypothetical protein